MGGPEMVALKMAVVGTLIVLKVPPVMGGARERRVANLGYSSGKVSCNTAIPGGRGMRLFWIFRGRGRYRG